MSANTKLIIYDDSCSMCAAYTRAFINAGFLGKNGREKFTTIRPDLLQLIDTKKAVNEIPFIDTDTKQVWYGIDALLEILGTKFRLIKLIGNISPLKWVLLRLYKIISFNRRVIVASLPAAGSFDCTPDFNVRYRVFFMFVFLVFNTLMLYPVQHHILQQSVFTGAGVEQLQQAHFFIVGINMLLGLQLGKRKGIEYLGQVNMLALIGILFTIPLVMVNKFLSLQIKMLNNFYLLLLLVFISREYFRRMQYAGIIGRSKRVMLVNGVSVCAMLLYLIFIR